MLLLLELPAIWASAPIAKFVKIPGLNSRRNSWSAVGKTVLTKLKKHYQKIRLRVIAKYSGSEFYNSLPGTTLSLPSTILSNGTLESSRIYSDSSNLPLMSQSHIPLEADRSNPSLFSIIFSCNILPLLYFVLT